MPLHVCRLNDITVTTGWYGVRMGYGLVVDLDSPSNPYQEGSPTLRESLGDLVEHFELVDDGGDGPSLDPHQGE